MSAAAALSEGFRRLASVLSGAANGAPLRAIQPEAHRAVQAQRLQLLASIYAAAGAGLCDDAGLMYAAAEAFSRAVEGD